MNEQRTDAVLRVELESEWRAALDRMTELSVELHRLDIDQPGVVTLVDDIERELADIRRTLVSIEVELDALRAPVRVGAA